jgi:hypothetical protein
VQHFAYRILEYWVLDVWRLVLTSSFLFISTPSNMLLDHQMKRVSFDFSKNLIVVERTEGVWYTRQELALIRRRDDDTEESEES